MRRIWTSTDGSVVDHLCQELTKHEIAYSVDVEKNLDWGSESYGEIYSSIWIHDDADVERAKALLSRWVSIHTSAAAPTSPLSSRPPLQQFLEHRFHTSFEDSTPHRKQRRPITMLFVLICALFLVVEHLSRDESVQFAASNVASETYQQLLFDYPAARVLENRLLHAYGPQGLDLAAPLDAQGAALRQQLVMTPYWAGVYSYAVDKMTSHGEIPVPSISPSLFGEKIREGQVWRLFTPALLHGDIFHLAFNMLWLLVLGSQIERIVGSVRYLVLIAILGIVSNTAQYAMSGPYFLGFSGIICGMASFIIQRQREAPWEEYSFSRTLYTSLLFFVWALVALSLASFFLECYAHLRFPIGFANTAHIGGLALGIALGKCTWFAQKVAAKQTLDES
jgi:GlpG protein